MTSSFKPDSKTASLAQAQEEFRPNHWPLADEEYKKAVTRAEQLLAEAEERSRQKEREGFEKGLEEGRAQGLAEAKQRLEPVVAAVEEACRKLEQHRKALLWDCEKSLARMAVAVARCVLRREVKADIQAVGEMVSHAIKEVEMNDILSLNIHPDDWDALNEVGLVGEEAAINLPRGIQVVRDESVGRGGCVIRSEEGSIDGRLDEQLSAILARFEDELEKSRPSEEEYVPWKEST